MEQLNNNNASNREDDFPTVSLPVIGAGDEKLKDNGFRVNPYELSSGDRLGDFEIIEAVGYGGMGVVYKAYEISLKRIVALKVLHPSIASNPSLIKRFKHEAILSANLSHPNIIPVFQIDDSEKPRYFTMEYVLGKSLQEKIEKEGFLTVEQSIRIIEQACEALQYAHKHNIIHRDSKLSHFLSG